MLKFVTISSYKQDQGLIMTCKGQVFVTKLENRPLILCSNTTTSVQEISYRTAKPINFLPLGAQGNMYPGSGINTDREKTSMYATEPLPISGLIYNGQIVAASKTAPLILYYNYENNQLTLSLYDLQARANTQITSIATSNITGIESCQFLVGAFASNKQQDIFASCNVLNITNTFFMQEDQYQSSMRGLGTWCNNVTTINNGNSTLTRIVHNQVILGDFNGDKLSDLFCVNSRYAMINKRDAFVSTFLIKNQPGNWATRFISQKNIAIGDFDSNGISDLVSLTNNANPQILFHGGLSNFSSYAGNSNEDGSFTINTNSNWCGANATNSQLVVVDVDNDGKDDLLCKTSDGKVYLALSRTDKYPLAPNQMIKQVVVTLDNYEFGENIAYFISDKNVPLFCDASKLVEYHTKLSCSLKSPNQVDQVTNPIRLSNIIPKTEINNNIKGSVYLGDEERYGNIDLVNEQILNDIGKRHFPKGKFWKSERKDFVDPTRSFETRVNTQYIRQGRISEKKLHLSQHSYGYRTHGGDCNEINFSHITLTNNFTASGRIEFYDQNGNRIMEQDLVRDLANMYVLSGNSTTLLGTEVTTRINNVAGGAVSFTFTGEMALQTLYQKNVTWCSIVGIKASDLTNNQVNQRPVLIDDQSSMCLLASDSPLQYTNTTAISGSTREPSLLTRAEILELNGIIHAGGSFYPDAIKGNSSASAATNAAQSLQVDRYGEQVSDLHSRLSYNNSIKLNAYVKGNGQYFDKPPHNELMVEFTRNGAVIFEPTRIKFENGTLSTTPASLYAGFDNIKLVKLAAFDPTHVLLAWTIYIAQEKQYYLLVDYVNTGGNILRIPLYEQDFNLVIVNQRFGNEFYISYRSSPDKLVISRYSAESFALSRTIEINTDGVDNTDNTNSNAESSSNNGNSKFILQVDEQVIPDDTATAIPNNTNSTSTTNPINSTNSSTTTSSTSPNSNLVLIRSYGNNKGLFVKKFDIFLNEIGSDTNIICDAQPQTQAQAQNIDKLPTKIDEAYDVLRLKFKHNSKIVYHDTDRSANLDKKIKLQNGLNFIYRGLDYLQNILANPDSQTQSKIKASLASLVCDSVLSYEQLNEAIKKAKALLQTDLTFEVHTATSNKICKGSSYYPIYRVGNTVHLCTSFDAIDIMNECDRLIALSTSVKGLISQDTPFVASNILAQLLPFFPSNVIAGFTQIINSDYVSNGDIAAICDSGGVYNQQVTQVSNNYASNVANNLMAGLLSKDAPRLKVLLNQDYNGCLGMTLRGCSASYDKEANILCMSYIFEASTTASIVAEAADSNIDVRYNCATGCNLDSPALAKLASSIGGYFTSTIARTFIPRDKSYILKQVGSTAQPQAQAQTSTASTTTSSTSTTASKAAQETFTVTNEKILTAAPTYFYEKDSSLITFAYLGNNYIDLKAQFLKLNSTTGLGVEQLLGRFLNVRQIQTIAFNQSSVLIGYSVKHPTQDRYNIIVQSISSGASVLSITSQIVNIYPSYNGVFSLDIVPSRTANTATAAATTAKSEFMISYPEDITRITTKRYQVTPNSITEQMRVGEQVSAIPALALNNPNITVPSLSVNAFLDNTFNVIWSYLDQSGIWIQRYNQQNGAKIGVLENIARPDQQPQPPVQGQGQTQIQYPQTLKVGAGEEGKTIVSWQNQDQIHFSMINQTPAATAEQPTQQTLQQNILNFAANNYTLQDAKIVDEISDIVSLTLKDLSNNLKTILVSSKSDALTLEDILIAENGLLSIMANNTKNITDSTNNANSDNAAGNVNNLNNMFSEMLGSISKNLNINSNNQQCPINQDQSTNGNINFNDILGNLNIEDIMAQAEGMLKDKSSLVDQIQSALNIPQVKESLDKLGIKEDVIYSMIDKLNSIADLQDYIKNNLNKFKDFDLSQIPDTDITEQIQAAMSFNSSIQEALRNAAGRGSTSSSGGAQGSSNIFDGLTEDQIIEFVHGIFKDILIQLIRTTMQPIVDLAQGDNAQDQAIQTTILVAMLAMVAGIGALLGTIEASLFFSLMEGNPIKVVQESLSTRRELLRTSGQKIIFFSFACIAVTLAVGLPLFFHFKKRDNNNPLPPQPAPAPTQISYSNCFHAEVQEYDDITTSCLTANNCYNSVLESNIIWVYTAKNSISVSVMSEYQLVRQVLNTISQAQQPSSLSAKYISSYNRYICNNGNMDVWRLFQSNINRILNLPHLSVAVYASRDCTPDLQSCGDKYRSNLGAFQEDKKSIILAEYATLQNSITGEHINDNSVFNTFKQNLATKGLSQDEVELAVDAIHVHTAEVTDTPQRCYNSPQILLCPSYFISENNYDKGATMLHELAHLVYEAEDCPSDQIACNGVKIGYNSTRCSEYLCGCGTLVDPTCIDAFFQFLI